MNTIYDKILTPHWLPRLLGAKKATLAISSAGLILKRRNAESRKVPIENLTRETAWHRGRLFSELALQTDRGAQRLKGLRASEVEGFFRLVAGLPALVARRSKTRACGAAMR